jgi:hypothetical protein
MQFAVFKGEKNVSDLVSRVFQIKIPGSPEATQAADALLAANPQLADPASVAAGSVIVIPETASPVSAAELVKPAALLPLDPTQLVKQQVTGLGSSFGSLATNAVAQANAALALVQSQAIQAAAAKDPALAQRVASISQNTKAALADLQAKQAIIQQALAQLPGGLATFLKPIGK